MIRRSLLPLRPARALLVTLLTAARALAQEPPAEPPKEREQSADATRAPAPQAAPPRSAEPVEVSVVGTRLKQTAGSAHVVNRRTLERFEYDDPHAVLRSVPGVYVREEDGTGLRPNIGLRGATSDRSKKITLMEDGVLIAPAPYSAPAAYYFPLITRMTQVRVLKGPAAQSYGPQTIAGAIDLVTRGIPAADTIELDIAGGEYAYGKFHGFAGTSTDRMGLLIEGVHLRNDGYKELPGGEDTGFYRNEWMLKGSYSPDPTARAPHQLSLKLSYSDELSNETYLGLTDADFRRDPLSRYPASKLDQMRWHRTGVALTHEVSPVRGFTVTTTAYRNDLTRVWRKVNGFRGASLFDVLTNPESTRGRTFYAVLTGQIPGSDQTDGDLRLLIGPNARDFVAQGVETRLRWDGRTGPFVHRLEYGLRIHYDRVERRHTQDGFFVVGDELVPEGGETEVTLENEAWTEALAVHAIDAVGFGNLTITPGVRVELMRSALLNRLDRTRQSAAAQAVLPGVGVFYGITGELGVLAGVYRGFSPPPPGEDQSPELSTNYEAGARYSEGPARAELIGYYDDYSNLVDVCTLSSGCLDENLDRQYDAGRARIYGIEAYAAHDLRAGPLTLPLSLTYTLTVSELLETFESADPIFGSVVAGDEIPYLPRHQANASVGIEARRAGGYVVATYVAATREQAGTGPLDEVIATDEQFTLNLGAKYRLAESAELYANVRNVLDAHYIVSRRPFGARPNAPRWAELGAKLRF